MLISNTHVTRRRLVFVTLGFVLTMMLAPVHAQDDAPPLQKISDIQGTEDESPFDRDTVRVQGIVTADYQDNLAMGGFFIQAAIDQIDDTDLSSEGVFVYCDPDGVYDFGDEDENPEVCTDIDGIADVNIGDQVEVIGRVNEFGDMTQLNIIAGSVTVISQDNALPDPLILDIQAMLDMEAPAGIDYATLYEPYEGMLVTITTPLTVAEYFQLFRYGQVVLYANGRPYQYTHMDDTPTDEEAALYELDLDRRRIVLDDASMVENVALVSDAATIFHPAPNGFGVGEQGETFFRGGDVIENLTGILTYNFGDWRIQPVPYAPIVFTVTNPRTETPPTVEGSITVASFNVLNYFTTLGERGADSPAELDRQAEKIVESILAIGADVYGLMEIENNVTALADLVDRLNRVAGEGTYDYIDTGIIGTDAIAVAIIYQPAAVTPIGETAILDDDGFTNPFDASTPRNRPAIAQTFSDNATEESFTVVVNHLKSKGSECGAGDDDRWQGNCNLTRTAAAEYMIDWLADDPTQTGDPDILIIGDLNAYAGEDPIDVLRAAGYEDLQGGVSSPSYSYVFDGRIGYLDYALASESLAPQVVDIAEWHINADEVPVFDYNDTELDQGERAFEQEPDGNTLYEANPFRASDHDPVIVGLELGG